MEQRQQHRESPKTRSQRVKKLSAPSSRPRWIGLIVRFVAVLFVIVIVLFIILSFFRALLLSLSSLLILLLVVIGLGVILSGFLPKLVRGMMGEVIGWCLKFVFGLCLWFLSLLVQALRWPLAMQILSRSGDHVWKWPGKLRGSSGEEAGGHAVLGHVINGNLPWCLGSRLVLPAEELSKHGVVIGGSGSGKTVSLLRLAYVAAKVYGYRVYFLDCKGDRNTAAQFLAMMRQAGYTPRMFPRESLDGWRGDGNAIFNRLVAVESFSEPYYRAVTKRVLTLICNDQAGPPRNSQVFFSQFSDDLKDQAKLDKRDLAGVELRYRAFFDVLGGKLDAGWSWEDCDGAYILLDGLSLKEETASLGRYILEDFAHYATSRKKPGRDLLIIDEYSALAQSGTDAANLVERLRSYECAVVLSSQSYAGLGKAEDTERILDAANWLLLHRCAAPEKLTSRAGRKTVVKKSYHQSRNEIRESAKLDEDQAIHPDQARRLSTGEALLIAHGGYVQAQIFPPPTTRSELVGGALFWIEQQGTSSSGQGPVVEVEEFRGLQSNCLPPPEAL